MLIRLLCMGNDWFDFNDGFNVPSICYYDLTLFIFIEYQKAIK